MAHARAAARAPSPPFSPSSAAAVRALQTAASAAAFVANALSFPDDYDKDDGAAAGNEEDAVVDAAVSAVRAEMQRLERAS